MAAHRYWRFYVTAPGNMGYVAAIEIELFDQDLAKLPLTGAAFSSPSNYPDWVAANAFNGDFAGSSIGWANNGNLPGVPAWIKVDAGSGNAYDVSAFSWTSRASLPDQGPKDFSLQYSDDDSAWTTLLTFSGETWTSTSETRVYPLGTVIPSGAPQFAMLTLF
jgi:hypothetical protein